MILSFTYDNNVNDGGCNERDQTEGNEGEAPVGHQGHDTGSDEYGEALNEEACCSPTSSIGNLSHSCVVLCTKEYCLISSIHGFITTVTSCHLVFYLS